jgi:hypothetical protein
MNIYKYNRSIPLVYISFILPLLHIGTFQWQSMYLFLWLPEDGPAQGKYVAEIKYKQHKQMV